MKYERDETLSRLGPRGWYIDHQGSERCPGRCTQLAPDPTCDVGEALYRLRRKEMQKTTGLRK